MLSDTLTDTHLYRVPGYGTRANCGTFGADPLRRPFEDVRPILGVPVQKKRSKGGGKQRKMHQRGRRAAQRNAGDGDTDSDPDAEPGT